jgi:hypothetical protein
MPRISEKSAGFVPSARPEETVFSSRRRRRRRR